MNKKGTNKSAGAGLTDTINRASRWTARVCGHPLAFALSALMIVVWAATGPVFKFSDTWQLIINTTTTITTFLMVFLIQNTQNRDTEAMQVKLDELIRATSGASNRLLNLEDLTEQEIDELRKRYLRLAETAQQHAERARKLKTREG
jgi:low affinity Fe/Cu permease